MDALDFPFVPSKRGVNEKVMDLLYFFLSNLAGSQVQMIQRCLKIVSRCVVLTAMVFHPQPVMERNRFGWIPGATKLAIFGYWPPSFLFWKASH